VAFSLSQHLDFSLFYSKIAFRKTKQPKRKVFDMIMIQLILTIVLLILIVPIGSLLLNELGKRDMWFTTCNEGEIKFIVRGGSLHKIIINVKGHYLSENDEIKKIKNKKKPRQNAESLFTEKTGVYFIHWLYPIYHIHIYKFSWDSLELPLEHKTASSDIVDMNIQSREEFIDSLFFVYTYPVVAKEVELEGNFTVNIYVNITIQVVFPIIPVFWLNGNWFLPVTSTVSGAISDYARNMDFDAFRKELKEGQDSKFSKTIRSINDATQNTDLNSTDSTEEGKGGIIEKFGIKITKVNYIKTELAGISKEVQEATLAKEKARYEAEAAIETAKGTAEATKLQGEAEACALAVQLTAAVKTEGGVNVIIERLRNEGITKFPGSSLVLDRGVLPTLPLESKKKEEVE